MATMHALGSTRAIQDARHAADKLSILVRWFFVVTTGLLFATDATGETSPIRLGCYSAWCGETPEELIANYGYWRDGGATVRRGMPSGNTTDTEWVIKVPPLYLDSRQYIYPGNYCPSRGTLGIPYRGITVIYPPYDPRGAICPDICPAGSVLNIDSGLCVPSCPPATHVMYGTTCIPKESAKEPPPRSCQSGADEAGLSIGNPISAGTGSKFHTEPIFASGGLTYELNYFGRPMTSEYRPASVHGVFWSSTLARSMKATVGGSGPIIVAASRPNGQLLSFVQQGTSTSFLPDADINHRLTRLTNGANGTGATIGWRLLDADSGETEVYDQLGRLITIAQRQGLILNLSYDASGRLVSVANGFGRRLVFGYDVAGRMATLTMPEGHQVTFTYDSAGNLSTIVWPDGSLRGFIYEGSALPNNLAGIVDENGVRYSTYAYDASGRAVATEHAGGVDRFELSYSAEATLVVDPVGSRRQYELRRVQGIVRSAGVSQPAGSGCAGSVRTSAHDASGNRTIVADFNGTESRYTFDLARNLETQRLHGVGGATQRTTTTEWHSYWRHPIRRSQPFLLTHWIINGDTSLGQIVSCSPSGFDLPALAGGARPPGVVCQQVDQPTSDSTGAQGLSAVPDGESRIRRFTYDQFGQIATISVGPNSEQGYRYYGNSVFLGSVPNEIGHTVGDLQSITNPAGHVTQFTQYDRAGRVRQMIDPKGVVTDISYTPRGWVRTVVTTAPGGAGRTTTYTYDGVGQLTGVNQPDGTALSYSYDAAHRLVGVTDAKGNSVSYTLDNAGNRISEDIKDPMGVLQRSISRSFDALNRVQQVTGAAR